MVSVKLVCLKILIYRCFIVCFIFNYKWGWSNIFFLIYFCECVGVGYGLLDVKSCILRYLEGGGSGSVILSLGVELWRVGCGVMWC